MIEWLKSVVPVEEQPKIKIDNIQNYVPDQTHVYADGRLIVSAYTLRWFIKRIKKIVSSSNKKWDQVSLQEIENG
tara:strand:+ start:574 stop:798 length:225 start_codon:yes stop_codon:yes gene_type:complete